MRPSYRLSLVAAVFAAIFAVQPRAQAPVKTFPYDHIHLRVAGPEGSQWYEKNFGGKRITEAPDRLMYGSDCSDAAGVGTACSGSQQLAAVRRLAPDQQVVRKILYTNASRLLKIT